MVQVSRDSFNRADIVREVVKTRMGCQWCGGQRAKGGLFQYSVWHDSGRVCEDSRRVLRDRLYEVLSWLTLRIGKSAKVARAVKRVRLAIGVRWASRAAPFGFPSMGTSTCFGAPCKKP